MARTPPPLPPDSLETESPELPGYDTVTRGNHRAYGDQKVDGNKFIEKSCVVRQNIHCAKALEAHAYTIELSEAVTYVSDPDNPRYDDEHIYVTELSGGFIKNDADGNFLFDQTAVINDLADVDTVSNPPDTGDVLQWDGTNWVPASLGDTGVTDFLSLTDTPSAYTSSAGYFVRVNGTPDALVFSSPADSASVIGPEISFGDLADVDMTTNAPNVNDHLRWDGTNWIPSPAAAKTFLELNDTPAAYTGSGGYFVKVNSGATGLEFVVDDLASTYVSFNGVETVTNKTFGTGGEAFAVPSGGYISDGNAGDEYLQFVASATPVNYLKLTSADAGSAVLLESDGDDADVDWDLKTKGDGQLSLYVRGAALPVAPNNQVPPNDPAAAAIYVKDSAGGDIKSIQFSESAATAGDNIFLALSPQNNQYIIRASGDQSVRLVFMTNSPSRGFHFRPGGLSPGAGGFLKHDAAGKLLFNSTIALTDLPALGLDDLSDVDLTTVAPAGGDVLSYNGTAWVPAAAATPAAHTLGSHSDVDLVTTAPVTGDHLEYDGTNWVPAAPTGGGATAIDDLSDVDTTTTAPNNGDVLEWDGSNWVPQAHQHTLNALTDTNITSPLTYAPLAWDGAADWIDSANLRMTTFWATNNNQKMLEFVPTGTAPNQDSSVHIEIRNRILPGKPIITVNNRSGSAANVGLRIQPKGTGDIEIRAAGYTTAGFVKNTNAGVVQMGQSIALGDLPAIGLDDLSDVDLTTTAPVNGDILLFNGTNWVPAAADTPGAHTLGSHSDVTLTSPNTGDFVRFNGSAWVNVTIVDADVPTVLTIDNLLDGSGNVWLDVDQQASAVNWIGIENAATGTGPLLKSEGSDTNVDLRLATQGTGKFVFLPGGSAPSAGLLSVDASGNLVFNSGVTDADVPNVLTIANLIDTSGNVWLDVDPQASAVNFIGIENAATGTGPLLKAEGTDTNVELRLAGQGTGDVRIQINDFIVTDGDCVLESSDNAYYLGDPATDGSWRFIRSGTDLEVERRESAAWVSKGTFTA